MWCVCPSLIDRKKRISKSYRACRSNNNSQSNCCVNNSNSPLCGDEAGNEQRHSGRRRPDELCTRTRSNINSRSRPLYIPQNEWSGHHNESSNESEGHLAVIQLQQPKRQQLERPTELFLPTKQFENGHTNTKSQASTYMEQFWICTKRRKSSFGFGKTSEARENLLHETAKPKQ